MPGGARAVERVQGSDRFITAAAAAGSVDEAAVAYVANGTGFADALAGGPAAILDGGPLLLVEADAVPAATSDALAELAPERIVLLGGEGAIGTAVEQELAAIAPTSRRSGADRWATAAAVRVPPVRTRSPRCSSSAFEASCTTRCARSPRSDSATTAATTARITRGRARSVSTRRRSPPLCAAAWSRCPSR